MYVYLFFVSYLLYPLTCLLVVVVAVCGIILRCSEPLSNKLELDFGPFLPSSSTLFHQINNWATNEVRKAMEKVDVIDISAFTDKSKPYNENEKKDVLQRWDKSFQTLGFATITGHGVSNDIVEQLRKDAKEFFTQKLEEKMKCCLRQGYGKGGYVPMGVESVARSTSNDDDDDGNKPTDFVENIAFHHGASEKDIIPDYPIGIKESVQQYWKELKNLLSTIMEISSLSLGLPKDFFAPSYIDPQLALRLAYYPPQDQTKHKNNQMRYGAHTDYEGFTLLKQDDEIAGLQVFSEKENDWIPVEIIKDSFVLNAGDLIQRWTNDHWKSNLHRVVNPPVEISHKDRLSLVFFTGPNKNTLITPLEIFVDKDKEPKYEPILAGDHLLQKLAKTSTKNA